MTIDGQPVKGLGVLFSQAGFRSSSGLTDEDGKYELKYVKNTMGAVVGPHQVRIDYISREGSKRRKRLPPKFNRDSELSAQVEPGNNKINFQLDSE